MAGGINVEDPWVFGNYAFSPHLLPNVCMNKLSNG